MKKLIIICSMAFFAFHYSPTKAQGLYFGIEGGYGLPSGVQDIQSWGMQNGTSTQTNNGTNNSSSRTDNSQSFSLGSGATIGIYGGYMLTKNIGFQLGIGDKLSSSTTSTFTNTSSDVSPLPANSSTSTDNYTLTGGSSLQITPAIRLCAGGDGKLQPYSVIGLIIGTSPTATWEDKNTSSSTGNPTNITDEVQTISGGMMLGFHGSIGLLYKVTDQIGISAEIFEDVMNWSPSKSVITTYTDNGVSQLSNMTTSQIETDYGSSATTSSTSSPGSPTQSTYVHFPWSSYGFRISVQYSLGGK